MLLNFFWRFICQSEDKQKEFLNCEIKTETREVFHTNKCFVASILQSMSIAIPESEELLTIIMPKHSQEDLRNLLHGFITYKSEDTFQISKVEVVGSGQSSGESGTCVALGPKDQNKPQQISAVNKEENNKKTTYGGDKLEGDRRTFVKRGVYLSSNHSSGQPQKERNFVGSKNQSSSQKTFLCDFCGKEFSTARKLKDHRYRVHSSATYFCGVCGKEFKDNCILSNHLKTHKEPSFSCQICLKVNIEHFA